MPRRSPRGINSSKPAAKQHPLSEGNEQSALSNHITSKKDPNARNTTTLRLTPEATIAPKAAAKSSPKSQDKAKAVLQSNRRISKRPMSADPKPPFSFTHNFGSRRGAIVAAHFEQHIEGDPERSASRHHTKRHNGKAGDPRKTSASGRDTQNKVSSESIAELTPAYAGSAATLHSEDHQGEPIQEGLCTSGSRQLLTKEALEELDRKLEYDRTQSYRSAKEIAVGHYREESEDGSSQGTEIDSRERFNRRWGYVPPLDEKTIRIIETIIKDPTRAETMVGIGPESPLFLDGLRDRNVQTEPSRHLDPRKEEIQSISLEGYLQETQVQEKAHEELWNLDKVKCRPDSSETLYQRTIMIHLIARHFLIYQLDSSKQQIFDFSVEEPWGCLPMPSRFLWDLTEGQKSEAKFLTQPKPNLAVCFKREAVIPDRIWKGLPKSTRGLACFENLLSNESRIFHFLAVEAKKATINLNSSQALYQCLNNASQALHNMFEFFRDAGPEHEQIFYDKVRFFSVVANTDGILVRIHRAIRVPDNASPCELVLPDRPDYRLEFEFQEFQRIQEADGIPRRKVLEVIKRILRYASDDLLKWIDAAASTLYLKLQEDLQLFHARRRLDFYSYGPPNPKDFERTRSTRGVPSAIGDWLQGQSQTQLDPKNRPLDESIARAQSTPNRPHQPVISSPLANTANKRGVDEIESDELEDKRAPARSIRKRQRRS